MPSPIGSQTTGTMDNWYHAIFDIGGQLDHPVMSRWTTGTIKFFQSGQLGPDAIFGMGGQLGPFPILLIYWYHLSLTGVDSSPTIWVTQLSPIVR